MLGMCTQSPNRRPLTAILWALTASFLLSPVADAQSPDPLESCEANGRVEDVIGSGGVFYATGSFTSATAKDRLSTVARIGLMAWSARTGELLPWAPTVTHSRYQFRVDSLAVSPDGQTIYFGGLFETANGVARRNVAAVDLQGNLKAWTPMWLNVGRVRDLKLSADGSRIYIGGEYGVRVYGTQDMAEAPDRGFQAAILDGNGNDSGVWALELSADDQTLYLGSNAGPGHFESVNGWPRSGLAAVDANTGATIASFAPQVLDTHWRAPWADVWDLRWYEGSLYAFGDWFFAWSDGVRVGDGVRQRQCLKLDPVTGNADGNVMPWADGGVQGGDIDPITNRAYAVGHFDRFAAPSEHPNITIHRKDAAVFDLADGAARSWRPGTWHSQFKSQVYGIDVAAGRVAMCGEFERVRYTEQDGIAMFELANRRALFVVGDPGAMQPLDRFVYGRLERHLGFDVTLQDDDLGDGSEADGMDVVIISNSASWSNLRRRYREATAPVLTWNASMLGQMGMTRGWWNTDSGIEYLDQVNIVDATHAIAAGIPGPQVAAYGQAYPVVWGQPVPAAHVVAATPLGRPTLFTLQTGDALWDGTPAAGSRIAFPLRREYGTTAPDIEHELWRMFDRSIRFLVDGCGEAVQRLTQGCSTSRYPLLEFSAAPRVNGPFDVDLIFAPGDQVAVLAADFQQPFLQAVTSTCSSVAWSANAVHLPANVSPWGRARWRFPVANIPDFIGQAFHLQAMIPDAGGPVNGSFALSEGYRVVIQP